LNGRSPPETLERTFTMRDELFDRSYAEGRAQLNDGIDRAVQGLGATLKTSLKALHRVEWSAPWKQQAKRAR
jgi:hypothetical protein